MTNGHHHDPYDEMTDEEFEEHTGWLFEHHKDGAAFVTIRVPDELMRRVERVAAARHTHSHRLMDEILESVVEKLEHRAPV